MSDQLVLLMEHLSPYNTNSDFQRRSCFTYPAIDVLIYYNHVICQFQMFIRKYYVDEEDDDEIHILYDYDGPDDPRFQNKYFELKDVTREDGTLKPLPIKHETHLFQLSEATHIPRLIARMNQDMTTRSGVVENKDALGCFPHQYSLFKIQSNHVLFHDRDARKNFDRVMQACGERITFVSFNECNVETLMSELEMLKITC